MDYQKDPSEVRPFRAFSDPETSVETLRFASGSRLVTSLPPSEPALLGGSRDFATTCNWTYNPACKWAQPYKAS